MTESVKKCTRCLVAKPIGEFNRKTGEQRQSACRDCQYGARRAAEMKCVRCSERKPIELFAIGEKGCRKRICLTCSMPDPEGKRCNKCREVKQPDEFHRQPNSPDGYTYSCKPCSSTYTKDHYATNRDRVALVHKEWYEANRERVLAKRSAWHQERKRIVIDRYGGKCVCCGETILAFLSIDHVNNDGAEHRRSLGHGKISTRIYAWAMKNEYPDSLQVLCMNCNCGKQWNGGVCPHEEQP